MNIVFITIVSDIRQLARGPIHSNLINTVKIDHLLKEKISYGNEDSRRLHRMRRLRHRMPHRIHHRRHALLDQRHHLRGMRRPLRQPPVRLGLPRGVHCKVRSLTSSGLAPRRRPPCVGPAAAGAVLFNPYPPFLPVFPSCGSLPLPHFFGFITAPLPPNVTGLLLNLQVFFSYHQYNLSTDNFLLPN